MAAEYIAQRGNLDIVLCERGIRTFEKATRNTLDISAVPVVHGLSHLPVIVDPSHSGGRRDLVLPLSRAAIAVGADGIIVDVHPHPGERALRRAAGARQRRPARTRRSRPTAAADAGAPTGRPGAAADRIRGFRTRQGCEEQRRLTASARAPRPTQLRSSADDAQRSA
jgi:3-deoxy-7-phosphoheptulonate synthase